MKRLISMTMAGAVLCISSLSLLAANGDKPSYQLGLAAAQRSEWQIAIDQLTSPGSKCAANCNFVLAICYSNLHIKTKTFDYALAALESSPKLDVADIESAKRLLAWAASDRFDKFKVSFAYSDDEETNEVESEKKQKLKKKRESAISALRIRANRYINVEGELLSNSICKKSDPLADCDGEIPDASLPAVNRH
jgi:hypothetical protein